MACKTDWMDFAHALDKRRAEMQDSLPEGFVLCLTLSSYEYGGGRYDVSVWHRDKSLELRGHGSGRTPEKALQAAADDLKKNAAAKGKTLQIVGARALPAKR